MATLKIAPDEWREERSGLLYAYVGGIAAHAFAVRVLESDPEKDLWQRAADEENEDTLTHLYALCDCGVFEPVEIEGRPGGWVIWVEPAS